MNKPKNIALAVKLLWIGFTFGVISSFLYLFISIPYDKVTYCILAIVDVISFSLVAFLYLKISSGKNWARIIAFILFLYAFYLLITLIPKFPIYRAVLLIIQYAITSYAYFLLFTKPGSAWFKKSTHLEPKDKVTSKKIMKCV